MHIAYHEKLQLVDMDHGLEWTSDDQRTFQEQINKQEDAGGVLILAQYNGIVAL